MDIQSHVCESVSAFQSTLQAFTYREETELDALQREVNSVAGEFAEQAGAKAQEMEQLNALYQQQQEEAAAVREQTSELQASVSALEARAQSELPQQLSLLQKRVALAGEEERRLASEVAAKETEHTREQALLNLGVTLFRSVLGFELAAAGGQLHVRFAYIRPSAGDALTHTLALLVDARKEYRVTACSPPLATMPALVSELNASSNFAKFVAQVRREFVRQEQQTGKTV